MQAIIKCKHPHLVFVYLPNTSPFFCLPPLLLFTSSAPIPPVIGRFYLLIIDYNHYSSFLNEICWSYRLPTTASIATIWQEETGGVCEPRNRAAKEGEQSCYEDNLICSAKPKAPTVAGIGSSGRKPPPWSMNLPPTKPALGVSVLSKQTKFFDKKAGMERFLRTN
jgi:hypothetical protein